MNERQIPDRGANLPNYINFVSFALIIATLISSVYVAWSNFNIIRFYLEFYWTKIFSIVLALIIILSEIFMIHKLAASRVRVTKSIQINLFRIIISFLLVWIVVYTGYRAMHELNMSNIQSEYFFVLFFQLMILILIIILILPVIGKRMKFS
jgi:hypothetical protein